MRKVPARRSLGPLAGLFLFLGLPAALPSSRPADGAAWWEIRLSVTVEGDYTVNGGGAPLAGRFTCRARWEGTIERDGDDFILYRLGSETLEWDLAEKAALPMGESLERAKETSEKPVLRLNYLLREGSDLRFDYDFREVSLPLHSASLTFDLEFPRSAGRGSLSLPSDYADFVRRGESRLVIPSSDLERPAAERTFVWEWRREKRVARDSRAVVVTQRHAAEAVISLRAR
jgi:hypothetical protein